MPLPLEQPHGSGFELDVDLETRAAETPHTTAKRAGELAEMFVNTRRTFKVDNNIVEATADDFGVSKATAVRVERVKATMGLKYMVLEKTIESEGLHAGVDGVYNPLQIIRNRKIRAKYKDHPKPLSIKTLPPAVNVFSRHNRRDNRWKCLWAIDLAEAISDRAWRAAHWHELRDPKGALWFPPSRPSSFLEKPRMHDRLFEDDMKMIPLSETKAGRRERIKRRMRRKPYSSSSEISLASVPSLKPESDPDDDKRETAVDNLQIRPLEKRDESYLDLQQLEESPTLSEPTCDAVELELLDVDHSIEFFKQSLGVGLHFMCEVYPQATEAIEKVSAQAVRSEMERLNRKIVDVNDDQIPSYEILCTAFLNEIKSLIHIINDDYSVKIDNLLSTSDRTTGELNTSMSLELKKIEERVERLNHSIFGGNVVTDALTDKKILTESSNRKVLYWCLENIIVVVLRLTWVVVNFYKAVTFVVRMAWRLVMVLLF